MVERVGGEAGPPAKDGAAPGMAEIRADLFLFGAVAGGEDGPAAVLLHFARRAVDSLAACRAGTTATEGICRGGANKVTKTAINVSVEATGTECFFIRVLTVYCNETGP